MSEWQPIETAPKDGTQVDLWIEGKDSTVDFYSASARKAKGRPVRHGRACDFKWMQKGPNRPYWYPSHGLGYPLDSDLTVTHWMPLPAPPSPPSGEP